MYHTGVEVTLPNQAPVVCRAKLLFNVCDLPAKAVIMNCNQYNGKHGCSACTHEGQQVRSGRGKTRVYGYHNCVPFEMRTNEEHLSKARQALESGEVSHYRRVLVAIAVLIPKCVLY